MSDSDDIAAAIQIMESEDVDVSSEVATETDPETVEAPEAEEPETEEPAEEDAEKEPEKEPEPEPEDKNPRISKALARVAKREANLLEMDTQLKAREEAVQARSAEMERVSKRFAELQSMADRDPLALVQEIGGPGFIDKLTKQLIHGEAPKAVDPELAKIKAELDEIKTRDSQRSEQEKRYAQQTEAQAMTRFASELSEYAASAEGMPFVRALGADAGRELLAVTKEHWERTKTILDRTEATRILNGRLQDRFAILSKAAGQSPAATPAQSNGAKPPKTLTQSQRSRTAKNPSMMSDDERLAAALDIMNREPE